jgi:CheY-like chemotaxis protein
MPLRIVIADDNLDLVESLADVLDHLGHKVVSATNGADALKCMESFRPDVALIDVGMPGMSGNEVAARARLQPWGQSIVLIALTGWGRGEDRELARRSGFDHVAVKPVDLEYLRVMLDRVGAISPYSMPAVQAAPGV